MKNYESCKLAMEASMVQKYFAVAHLYHEEKAMSVHIHDCYEIYYSISGGKQFLIGDKVYPIESGDLFFINPYESHHLTQMEDERLERIVISISPEYLKCKSTERTNLSSCFTNRAQGMLHKIALDKEQQKRFRYYIHKIGVDNCFGQDILEELAFLELMVELNAIFDEQHTHPYIEQQSRYSEQVDQILEYINENIQSIATIEKLAMHFYLSESYICRIFKAATGTTINKYVTARRISMAKALLSNNVSVNEVCEICGFNDYSNFLKSFRKTVGISPKKYAKFSGS